jgi:hypothetical protein
MSTTVTNQVDMRKARDFDKAFLAIVTEILSDNEFHARMVAIQQAY